MAESIGTFHHFLTQEALHLIATMDLLQAETAELAMIHTVSTNHTVTLALSHHWALRGQEPAGN